MHANKLRKYYVRGMNCIALIDNDESFDDIVEQPVLVDKVETAEVSYEH